MWALFRRCVVASLVRSCAVQSSEGLLGDTGRVKPRSRASVCASQHQGPVPCLALFLVSRLAGNRLR